MHHAQNCDIGGAAAEGGSDWLLADIAWAARIAKNNGKPGVPADDDRDKKGKVITPFGLTWWQQASRQCSRNGMEDGRERVEKMHVCTFPYLDDSTDWRSGGGRSELIKTATTDATADSHRNESARGSQRRRRSAEKGMKQFILLTGRLRRRLRRRRRRR